MRSNPFGISRFLWGFVLLVGMILLYTISACAPQNGVALQPTPSSNQFTELSEAQNRWRQNPIPDYRIKVLYPSMPNTEGSRGCIQESNVRTLEGVVHVEEIQNNCIHTEFLVGTTILCQQVNETGETQDIPCSDELRPPPTIENLFGFIEAATLQAASQCGPNGCGCDGTLVVRAAYDPDHGNPSRIWLEYGGPRPADYQSTITPVPGKVITCTLLGTSLNAQFEAFLTPLE